MTPIQTSDGGAQRQCEGGYEVGCPDECQAEPQQSNLGSTRPGHSRIARPNVEPQRLAVRPCAGAIIDVEVSMRAAAAVGVVACLGCLVACGSTLTPASGTRASTAVNSQSGTLTGVVKMYGGPMDATTGKQALNGSPGPHWTVHVRSGSEVVATATSDSSGRFTVQLPAGNYELDCLDPMPVPVLAGRTTAHDCAVAVP